MCVCVSAHILHHDHILIHAIVTNYFDVLISVYYMEYTNVKNTIVLNCFGFYIYTLSVLYLYIFSSCPEVYSGNSVYIYIYKYNIIY
jgi:hypothetical protein